ncbi:alpha/beta hydrolase superfamily protein [Burkholderia pseudomallei MSHR4308]|nr:alpha/beta hydrolase superfamily protein [Burkholderia pseudomallei MSHR4308]
MHERPPITAETTWFAARDGRLLTGTFYAPGAPSASNGRSVLVSGALGVPRGFYERYARFLASATALTGADLRLSAASASSRKPPRRGRRRDAARLGRSRSAGGARIIWPRARRRIGCSRSRTAVGGQTVRPRAPTTGRAAALLSICCPSGYWRLWPWPHRLWLAPLWFCVVPALGRVLSHLPVRRAGLGFAADLPAGVMREWARWCRHADYLVDDEGHPLREHFRGYRGRILAYTVSDDWMAPPAAVQALHRFYSTAQVEHREIAPDRRRHAIGHFGYFRDDNRALWPLGAAWLREQ